MPSPSNDCMDAEGRATREQLPSGGLGVAFVYVINGVAR